MELPNDDAAKDAADVAQDNGLALRKTNELISRPLVRGQFTLLGRKVFNSMILHAQQLRLPGLNAPGNAAAYQKLFWVPLSDIARDARYDSNDTEVLKEVARQLMDIQVESESETEWTADHLIEQIKIVNPAGLKKRGGRLWVGYRFPDEVLHLITDPSRYTRLPIYYLTLLRSNASVALYEVVKESAWKSSGLTVRAPWEDWQAILEGKPKSELQGWKREYKFFKDRVLKKAILEVTSVTDVAVELIEFKAGRSVTDIQFRVRKKEQANLEFPPPPTINSQTIDAICEFGVSRREAEDLLATNEEAFLQATCDYVRTRASDKKLPPLTSTAAFFRSALRGRYADAPKMKPTASKPKTVLPPQPSTAQPPEDIQRRKLRDDAAERLDAMDETERAALMEAFYQANPAIRVIVRNKPTKTLRIMLLNWMTANGR